MAHRGFFGMTESGKTSLAIAISQRFKHAGTCRLILDPFNDPRWTPVPDQDWIGDDAGTFTELWRGNEQCALFVDEGGKTVGRYAGEMVEVVTTARHWGHETHIISQRPQQMDPTIREQLSEIYVFRSSPGVAKIFAEDFANKRILTATELNKGEFFKCVRFADTDAERCVKCKIDPATGIVTFQE